MLSELLAPYLGTDVAEVEHLLKETPIQVHRNPKYRDLVDSLDFNVLSNTMVKSRHYMDEQLPTLVEFYSEKHGLEDFPLSGFMVCNWVVAYIKQPNTLPNLLRTHDNVSRVVMKDVLPDVLEMLGGVPEKPAEWQRAFSIVVIPLVAGMA